VIVARNQKEKQINKFASLEGRVLSLCPCWHKCIMLWHQFSHITIIKYYDLNLSTTHSSFDNASYFINKQISFCIFILFWTIKWSISYLHLCFSSFFFWKIGLCMLLLIKTWASLLRLKLGYVLTGFVLFVCYYTLKRKSYFELFLKQWFYGHASRFMILACCHWFINQLCFNPGQPFHSFYLSNVEKRKKKERKETMPWLR